VTAGDAFLRLALQNSGWDTLLWEASFTINSGAGVQRSADWVFAPPQRSSASRRKLVPTLFLLILLIMGMFGCPPCQSTRNGHLQQAENAYCAWTLLLSDLYQDKDDRSAVVI
jgi:hypothetical protein